MKEEGFEDRLKKLFNERHDLYVNLYIAEYQDFICSICNIRVCEKPDKFPSGPDRKGITCDICKLMPLCIDCMELHKSQQHQ